MLPSPTRTSVLSLILLGLATGCGGASSSTTRAEAASATLTISTSNPPEGDLNIIYLVQGKPEYQPARLGVPVEVPAGRVEVRAQSQVRDQTKLYLVSSALTELTLAPGDHTGFAVGYTVLDLEPASLEYHLVGLPPGVSARVGRHLSLSTYDGAWVWDSLPADLATVTVPTAAGAWSLGNGQIGVDGKRYAYSAEPSTLSLAPGQTAAVTLTFSLVP